MKGDTLCPPGTVPVVARGEREGRAGAGTGRPRTGAANDFAFRGGSAANELSELRDHGPGRAAAATNGAKRAGPVPAPQRRAARTPGHRRGSRRQHPPGSHGPERQRQHARESFRGAETQRQHRPGPFTWNVGVSTGAETLIRSFSTVRRSGGGWDEPARGRFAPPPRPRHSAEGSVSVQERRHLRAGELGAVAGVDDQAGNRDVLGRVEGDQPAVGLVLALDVGGARLGVDG